MSDIIDKVALILLPLKTLIKEYFDLSEQCDKASDEYMEIDKIVTARRNTTSYYKSLQAYYEEEKKIKKEDKEHEDKGNKRDELEEQIRTLTFKIGKLLPPAWVKIKVKGLPDYYYRKTSGNQGFQIKNVETIEKPKDLPF